ncbi:MAG: helix-hairpin-helix domain-containing protein, partial [Chlamydiia bacterium]|nr:helix-hairpin-helix domain-containing protein [Chlamydiia bacterium]
LTSKASEKTKFEQYYDFSEAVATIPSHRYLAIRRGEREEVLDFSLEVSEEDCNALIQRRVAWKAQGPWAAQLMQAIEDSAKRLLCPSVETDVRVELKLRADRSAVDIFADNLRNLLMAAPLGEFSVFGVDPGLRTGCKLAVVDSTGKFLENATLYVTASDRERQRAQAEFLALLDRHRPFAIAVGNGTGNREAEAFVRESLKLVGNPNVIVIQVNEAGASVYSASDVARDEFPDLDLTVRGAISIARRLQDPLAELVKIDPKSIGVGQYQHDVYQPMLQEKLHDVVESCVNAVGVELNTASASLLSYVAGIGMSLAKKVVAYRDAHGAFQTRDAVLKVPGLGPKTFEQAAGFLRIRRSKHPLDASAVHPERYALVEEMAQDAGIAVKDLIGNGKAIQMLDLKKYESASVGAFTLKDIVSELKKPGRDPRASFEPPKFREDVTTIQDLKPGMELEGVVTNVTAFGAFVDIGVHQDGLVHISELSDTFIKDPADAVSAGDKLKVRVLEVDAARKRISLSAKTGRETVKRPGAVNKRPAKEQFLSSPFAGL